MQNSTTDRPICLCFLILALLIIISQLQLSIKQVNCLNYHHHTSSIPQKEFHYLMKRPPLPISSDIKHYLPNGPPPYRPTKLALTSWYLMDKLKGTMYKSQAYYVFLDVLKQLNLIANQFTKDKTEFSKQLLEKLASKGANMLKLKWPLVMLNPNFVRELLSNPTFLVMLFHAIEVGYTSMPLKGLLLKPLVKMVAQRSPEAEEEIWWRRKRLYDAINGLGSSDLEPNLKTEHFRKPGKPALFAVPKLGKLLSRLGPLDTGIDYQRYEMLPDIPTDYLPEYFTEQLETLPEQYWLRR